VYLCRPAELARPQPSAISEAAHATAERLDDRLYARQLRLDLRERTALTSVTRSPQGTTMAALR
jgi:hypothetical protein